MVLTLANDVTSGLGRVGLTVKSDGKRLGLPGADQARVRAELKLNGDTTQMVIAAERSTSVIWCCCL